MKTHARATVTSVLVLGLVFVSGTLVGRAWDQRSERAEVAQADDPERPEGAEREEERDEGGDERRRTPMYERVGLNESQLVTVDSIVVDHRTRWREVHREHRDAYDKAYWNYVSELRAAIMAVMTQDQRAQYDSLLTANDERRRRDDDGR